LLENVGAFHFHVVVFGVAGCVHPSGKEETSLLGFFVIAEGLVALFSQAACHFICGVVVFLFAIGEETAVLFTLRTPAHAGAAVELAYTAARDHDVELALVHVAADVCHHDDELLVLVLEFSGIAVRGAIVAFTSEGQLEALAALAAVRGGHSSECKAVFFATIHRKRNLACASGAATARADATATVTNGVLASGIAYLGLAAVFGP